MAHAFRAGVFATAADKAFDGVTSWAGMGRTQHRGPRWNAAFLSGLPSDGKGVRPEGGWPEGRPGPGIVIRATVPAEAAHRMLRLKLNYTGDWRYVAPNDCDTGNNEIELRR